MMPSMSGGGAERVVSHLLKQWSEIEVELHLALVYPRSGFSYEIPKNVILHELNCRKVFYSIFKLNKLIKKIQPDVVFSSMLNVNSVLSFIKYFHSTWKLVIRENSVISKNIKHENFGGLRKLAYTWLYPHANRIICQSKDMASELIEINESLKENIRVIHNPTFIKRDNTENPFLGEGPHVLMVGRLSKEKRCEYAIQKFVECRAKFKKANLWFVGEGPEEQELKSLAKNLNLEDCIHFKGFQKEINHWYSFCDLYLLCSSHEGYPNSLLEALSLGCSVLVEKHSGGTLELMKEFKQNERYVEKLDLTDASLFESKTLSVNSKKNEERTQEIIDSYHSVVFK